MTTPEPPAEPTEGTGEAVRPPADAPPYGSPAADAPPPGDAPRYAGPQYGQAPAYGQQMAGPRNGLGTAALVLGIIGLLLCWTVFLGVILGVLALIFGIIGRKRATRREATNGGSALAGAVLGGVAILASIALVVAGAAFYQHHKKAFDNYRDCLDHASTSQDRQACAREFKQQVSP